MSDHSITTQPATGPALPIRWWQAVLLLCLFVSATGLGIYWGQTHIVAGIENGFLEVDPEHLDFGEVWVQDKFQWTLPITNTSSEPVEVLEFRTTCACTSIEPKSVVIPAGETVAIQLTVDLTTVIKSGVTAEDVEPFSMRVVPLLRNGLAQYSGWELKGRIMSPIVGGLPLLVFDDEVIAGAVPASATITIRCRQFVEGIDCERSSNGNIASVRIERVDELKAVYALSVTLSPNTPPGTLTERLMLNFTTANGQHMPSVPLSIRARVVSDIQLSPPEIALGRMAVSALAEETVTVSSRSGRPFVIESCDCDCDGVTVTFPSSIQDLSSADSFLLPMAFLATKTGDHSGVIRFQLRYQDDASVLETELRFTCQGFGE